jgi:serine protease Do
MRKHILTFVLLPLLFAAGGAQRFPSDSPQTFGISSEDSGASSYLGVDIADVTADRVTTLKLSEERGVEVTMVDQDAPAGKAGIKEHDVILRMNGTAVESKSQLQRMIRETPPGRVVELGLSRDGQPLTIKVQLADRRSEFPHLSKFNDKDFHIEIPPIPNIDVDIPNIGVVYVHSSARSGMMVENLTPQLGEFFGAKSGNGVLVRSVEKGSRAEKAGMRAGDVITRVGDQPVHDTSDFTHALHSHSSGSVNVIVIRDRREQTLTLTLPPRKESGEMIEESIDAPALDAETRQEVSVVQEEIARLRPEMELASEQARKAAQDLSQAYCDREKEFNNQAEKMGQEFAPELRDELQKSREKLEQEMKEMRLQIGGNAFDI